MLPRLRVLTAPVLLGASLLLAGAPVACPDRPPGDAALPRPAVHPLEGLPALALAPLLGDLRFASPVDAARAPGDGDGWYVVEQEGVVQHARPLPGGGWQARPLLDLRERVSRRHNEEGLLGLAFDPDFETAGALREGAFYVTYSVEPGPLARLSRFVLPPGATTADPDGEEVLLEVEQPWRNHNGGGLRFGPDGMLYWSLGDGGAGGDPLDHAQNRGTLLGSLLRLDVSTRSPYAVPPDNPFVRERDARGEIWAYGLRNLWRFSFDRQTGELWGGDVGQDAWEWVTVVERGGNHGWNLLEGFQRYALPADEPLPADLVPPVFAYPHDPDGQSITGGQVYRGEALPGLSGCYVFADFATRRLWALRRRPDGAVEHGLLLGADDGVPPVTSFAEDRDGELVLVGRDGWLQRLVPAPAGR